jgi:hypothetical protein
MNHLSRKWSMPLGAHVFSPLKKQLIGCGSKFLGEEDAFASSFGITRCTNCGKPHFGVCVVLNHEYFFDVVDLATSQSYVPR